MRTYVVIIVTLIIIAFLALVGLAGWKLYTANSVSPDKPFNRGMKEYEIANYSEAIHYFNDYLASERKSKKNSVARYYIALSLKNLGKYEQAKKNLALIINPREDSYRLSDDYEKYRAKAVVEYADICRIENIYEYYIIGQLELSLKLPNDPHIERKMNTQFGYQLLFKQEYDEAINYFLKANTELALLGKARAYYQSGNADKAFGVYEEFLTYNKHSKYNKEVFRTFKIQVHYQAMKHFKKNNFTTAIKYFRKLASFFPTSEEAEEALYHIAEAKYLEAKDYYSKADSERYEPLFRDALKWYSKTMENDIKVRDDEALLKIGITYYWLKDYAASYNAMNKFLFDYPSSKYAPSAQSWKEQAKKDLEYLGE